MDVTAREPKPNEGATPPAATSTLELDANDILEVAERLPERPTDDVAAPHEYDAFYHPVGRARTLAEATVETAALLPEATVMVQIRRRRRTATHVAAAILAVFAALTLVALVLPASRATPASVAGRVARAPSGEVTPLLAPERPAHLRLPRARVKRR